MVSLLDVLKSNRLTPYVADYDGYVVEYRGDETTCEILDDDMMSCFTIEEFDPTTNLLTCRASFGEDFVIGEDKLSLLKSSYVCIFGLVDDRSW